MPNPFDFALALPEILLLVLAIGVLLIDAFYGTANRRTTFLPF